MEPTAPDRAARIAAHRAPSKLDHVRFAYSMARIVLKTNPRLFWAMAFGLGFLFSFVASFVIMMIAVTF